MTAKFVVEASRAVRALPPTGRLVQWPKPRLALNVVGSGEGGGADVKGDLVRGLVGDLQRLTIDLDVDIILVTYGEKPYAAAQRVRREVLSDKEIEDTWQFDAVTDPGLITAARSLAEQAIESQLVLFVGAGVSAGAGVPTWDGLMRDVAGDAHIDGKAVERLMEKDLRDWATILERRLKPNGGLGTAVARRLNRFELYALAHGLLASLPSKEAITTNFDTLFEAASKIDKRTLAVLPESPRATDGRWLLKLHGTVTKPEKMVLTRSDFLDMPRLYGALMGLVQGLLMMRQLMFVGYSLRDEDFHELIHEVRIARGDDAAETTLGTVLTLWSDDLERELWADDLKIIPMMADRPPDGSTEEREAADRGAARQLEMFLDLVGYLSTTSAAFFLDETYDQLTGEEKEERELRDALRDLIRQTSEARLGSVGYKVWQFLEKDLGAKRATGGAGSDGK